MNYQVLDLKTTMPVDTLELHVLARAYYAAWRVIHGVAPEGRHPLPALNVSFNYVPTTNALHRRGLVAEIFGQGMAFKNLGQML